MKYRESPADEQTAAAPQPAAYTPPQPTDPPAAEGDAGWIEDWTGKPAGQPAQPAAVEVEETPEDEIRSGDPAHRRARAAATHGAATWLGIYRRPPSIRDAWDMSSVIDQRRIPGDSARLNGIWWALNRSVRIVLFAVALVLLVPTATLLYCACRPSRAIGLCVILLLALVIVPAIAGG